MSNTHWSLRPLRGLILSERREMRRQFQRATRLVEPILASRLEHEEVGHGDLMQWIIDHYPNQKDDVVLHTQLQLEAVQAATYNLAFQVAQPVVFRRIRIHDTEHVQLNHFFYDLLVHPEYIEPLREEIQTVSECCSGRWTPGALAKLRKCDSFLKESQRLNPIGLGESAL
jgi:hypothetical protein